MYAAGPRYLSTTSLRCATARDYMMDTVCGFVRHAVVTASSWESSEDQSYEQVRLTPCFCMFPPQYLAWRLGRGEGASSRVRQPTADVVPRKDYLRSDAASHSRTRVLWVWAQCVQNGKSKEERLGSLSCISSVLPE
jgi:hypothetical protein